MQDSDAFLSSGLKAELVYEKEKTKNARQATAFPRAARNI